MKKDQRFYLRRALELAVLAKASGDYPFGSILVDNEGNIILEAKNSQLIDNDITSHSELKLVREAARLYDKEFLKSCTMYNSAEPCTMCTGAIYRSGIRKIVYGISKLRLNEIRNTDTGIKYNIHELLNNSEKDFEVIGPSQDMLLEVEKPYL